MNRLDAVLPSEFYLDPTLSRAPDVECPRCLSQKGSVCQAYAHDELDGILRTYYGCRTCRFRWLKGRALTTYEQFKQSGLCLPLR